MRIIRGLISSRQKKERPQRFHPEFGPGGNSSAAPSEPSWRFMRLIRNGRRHWRQDPESGTAMVEFALVIPFLILILCGILDLGNLYFQKDLVNEAARQGARLAAVNDETSAAINTAIQQSYGNDLTAVANPATPISGSNVTVTVTTNVTIMTPVINAFFPENPYPVSGTCTMYVE